MFEKGMEIAAVLVLVAEMGWEILEDDSYEAVDGTIARELVVEQDDHAVNVVVFHGVIDELEYVPRWAL